MKPTSTIPDWICLPADLSDKARAVPGLPERLVRFIKLEVAMNEREQQRHSPEALALVARAKARVAKRRAEGTDREETLKEFGANYAEILKSL